MKNTPNAPFSCNYTPQIPELLLILNSTTIHYCYLIDFSGNHSLYSYQFKSQD